MVFIALVDVVSARAQRMNPLITDKATKGWFLGKICDATIETGSLTCDAQLEIIAFLN